MPDTIRPLTQYEQYAVCFVALAALGMAKLLPGRLQFGAKFFRAGTLWIYLLLSGAMGIFCLD